MQSQQLLTESEIFKDEVLSGTESTDRPSQEMSERSDYGQNHGQNLIETRCINPVPKSFILHLHEVLTRDRQSYRRRDSRLHSNVVDFKAGR
jgi:Fic family protein